MNEQVNNKLALNITKYRDMPKNTSACVFVFGLPGSGKTMLCKTADRPLHLDLEQNDDTPLEDTDIDCIKVSGLDDLKRTLSLLSSSSEAKDKYRTICIDSFNVALNDIDRSYHRAVGRVISGVRVTNYNLYGFITESAINLIKMISSLKSYNVYVTCHFKNGVKDANDNELSSASLGSANCYDAIAHTVNHLLFLRNVHNRDGVMVRTLITDGRYNSRSKTRSTKLLGEEKANLKYIFNKICG